MTKADDREFHAYVSERMDRWRRSAYLLCQDWHTADDVVSVMIAKLYRHWSSVRAAKNPDAYAQRVLSRVWIDERRRPWRREERLVEAEPAPTVVAEVTDRDSLAAMLASLGRRQRAVVVLRFYLDYSVAETAEILGISEGTVKSQSARGLQALRLNYES